MLAPTGTISFMMDCDTTGVEPDFSLVKSKKLVGGGEITIVNKTVPMALEKLGYAPEEVEEIVAFIDERNTVVGAPFVKAEHYPIFDCAIGDRAIHYSGHVKMMGAVQPFISGAISKTVNMPETATVEEVRDLFVDAWKLGVKAIAIYRDNCKVAQPLSSGDKDERRGARPRRDARAAAAAAARGPHRGRPQVPRRRVRGLHPRRPVRRRDARRHLRGHREGGHDARRPHELVHDLRLARPPVRRAARGLRLEVLRTCASSRRGPTNDADIRVAKSIVDYIFRWMGKKFLTIDQQEEIGILSAEVRARLAERYSDGEGKPASAESAAVPLDAPRPARRRSSTRTRTPSSAPAAAAAWSAQAPATRAGTAARTPAARSSAGSSRAAVSSLGIPADRDTRLVTAGAYLT